MKRRNLIGTSMLFLIAGMLTACGNDETDVLTKDGKVDVTKALEFKVNFADYNADEEVQATRTGKPVNDTISRQYVNLGNNLLTEVTVCRDTAKISPKAKTRALENGTYTMLAYQGGVYKGEVTGTITSGVFHHLGNKAIDLNPGTYDFVLYNDKVTRNGNTLKVEEANVETALIGLVNNYNVTATPAHQQVTFQLKHCAMRVRLQWVSYLPIVNPQGYFWSNSPSASTTYDIATGTWANDAPSSGVGLTYTGGGSNDANGVYKATSSYAYFLPKAAEWEMRLQTYGKTYNGVSFGGPAIALPTLPKEANASYLITYKLMFNFLYLMSDGTTGYLYETTYGGAPAATAKTPVGIVLSQSKRLAAGLYAGSGYWHDLPESAVKTNDGSYVRLQYEETFSDMQGYHYTWERNYGADYFSGPSIKANNSYFPAFWYAGHYINELSSKGIYLSGALGGKKWHLPSNAEWVYLYTLGFGNKALFTWYARYPCYGALLNEAFTQAGGTSLYGHNWSSTEIKNGYGNYSATEIVFSPTQIDWGYAFANAGAFYSRPFVYY